MNRIFLTAFSVLLLAGVAPVHSYAQQAPAVSIAEPLPPEREELARILAQGKLDAYAFRYPKGMLEFYKAHNYEFFWSYRGKPSRRASQAFDVLADSWSHGLNPVNYHVSLLQEWMDKGVSQAQLPAFEAVMSDAVTRYAHDMTGMRLSPRSIGEDTKSWSQGVDAVRAMEYLTAEKNVKDALGKLAPTGPLYNAMRANLEKLVADMAERPDAEPPPLDFRVTLHPGDVHPAVTQVRARLGFKNIDGPESEIYDEELARAVAKFQRANGLKPDALVGKRTLAAFNQGRRDKIIKLVANMERQRWMPRPMPERYIVVNVPAMELWAIDDGEIKLQMPVIVGKEKRATNSFITTITGIRFNPSWNVPDTIKTEDYLPALQKDPQALKKKGIELIQYTSDGYQTIAPESIDWSVMTPQSIKAIGMLQNPGDDNALGRIRVLMPNQYNIYLHDTNAPDLFSKDFRALSSGCIRLAEPSKVANFILGPNKGWSDARMSGYLEKSKTIEVKAEQQLPVFILYQTVWLDEKGDLIFGEDLYNRDSKLFNELKKSGQI